MLFNVLVLLVILGLMLNFKDFIVFFCLFVFYLVIIILVNYMRNILLFVFFFLFFIFVSAFSDNRFLYLKDDYSYDVYSVKIEGLSTNNFLKIFDGIKVIRIYPFVNPVYKKFIGNVFYSFKKNSMSDDLDLFRSSYLSLIKKNNYSDYNYLYINGIEIDKVDIYINGHDLYNFLNLNNGSVDFAVE